MIENFRKPELKSDIVNKTGNIFELFYVLISFVTSFFFFFLNDFKIALGDTSFENTQSFNLPGFMVNDSSFRHLLSSTLSFL